MITFDSEKATYTSSHISIPHGFGTKQLGDGRKKEVIFDLKNKLQAQHVISPKQAHTTNCKVITSTNRTAELSYIDGVLTQEKNTVLTVITADCVPIIFEDPVQKIIGISHQGWKGTLGKLPAKMIENMEALGSKREDIRCAIGPCINECCYEVSRDLALEFGSVFGEDMFTRKDNTYFINLLKISYLQLRVSGILKKHISYFPFCTSCDEKKFWSYRRDNGLKGEMISFVLLK